MNSQGINPDAANTDAAQRENFHYAAEPPILASVPCGFSTQTSPSPKGGSSAFQDGFSPIPVDPHGNDLGGRRERY